MGTKLASIYTTLNLEYLEENLHKIIAKKIRQRHKKIYQIMEKKSALLLHILVIPMELH